MSDTLELLIVELIVNGYTVEKIDEEILLLDGKIYTPTHIVVVGDESVRHWARTYPTFRSIISREYGGKVKFLPIH